MLLWLIKPFKKGLLLKNRIQSYKGKFFSLDLTSIKKGGKSENDRVASPEALRMQTVHAKVAVDVSGDNLAKSIVRSLYGTIIIISSKMWC